MSTLRWGDVACMRALTARHDLDAGRIVCHASPGATWPVLVGNLLGSLGKDRDALARDRWVRDGPALLGVWLRAEQVQHVIVLRAHTLPAAALEALAALVTGAAAILWLVWHHHDLPPRLAGITPPAVGWAYTVDLLSALEPGSAAAEADQVEVYRRVRTDAGREAQAWAIEPPPVDRRFAQPGCPLGALLQRLTIGATSRDKLFLRLHAAQLGFRDHGLRLELPAVADDSRLAALGPRLDTYGVGRLRRIACPTTAAAVMLALVTDSNPRGLASTSPSWTDRDARHVRKLGGTYRIPPRARPLVRAALLAVEQHPTPPTTALPDRTGRILGPRRMANLIQRAGSRIGLPVPEVAPGSLWDSTAPFAAAFTADAAVLPTSP